MFSAFLRVLRATHIKTQQNLFPCVPWPRYDLQDRQRVPHTQWQMLSSFIKPHLSALAHLCCSRWCLGDLRCPATCVRGGSSSAFQKPPWREANQMCSILHCEIPHVNSLGKFSGPPSRITGFGQAGMSLVLYFGFVSFFSISTPLYEHLGIIVTLHWDETGLQINAKSLFYTHNEIVGVAATPPDRSAWVSPL